MFHELNNNHVFLDCTPKTEEIKGKLNNCDYLSLKDVHTAKENINIFKRYTTEWEKILRHYIPDKGIYNQDILKT